MNMTEDVKEFFIYQSTSVIMVLRWAGKLCSFSLDLLLAMSPSGDSQ